MIRVIRGNRKWREKVEMKAVLFRDMASDMHSTPRHGLFLGIRCVWGARGAFIIDIISKLGLGVGDLHD